MVDHTDPIEVTVERPNVTVAVVCAAVQITVDPSTLLFPLVELVFPQAIKSADISASAIRVSIISVNASQAPLPLPIAVAVADTDVEVAVVVTVI